MKGETTVNAIVSDQQQNKTENDPSIEKRDLAPNDWIREKKAPENLIKAVLQKKQSSEAVPEADEEQQQREMAPNDWIRERKAPSKLLKAVMKHEQIRSQEEEEGGKEMAPNEWLRDRKAPSELMKVVMQKETVDGIPRHPEGKEMEPNDWLRQRKVPEVLIKAVMQQGKERKDVPAKESGEELGEPGREEARKALTDLIQRTMQPPDGKAEEEKEGIRNWEDVHWNEQRQAIETVAAALFELPPTEERYQQDIDSLKEWVPHHMRMEFLQTLLEKVKVAEPKEGTQKIPAVDQEEKNPAAIPDAHTEMTQSTVMQSFQNKVKYIFHHHDFLELNKFEKAGTMVVCLGQLLLLLIFCALLIRSLSLPAVSERAKSLLSNQFKDTMAEVATRSGILLFFSLSILALSSQGLVGLLLQRDFFFRLYAASNVVYVLYAITMISVIAVGYQSHMMTAFEELVTRPSTMSALKCCGINNLDDFLRYRNREVVKEWKHECMMQNYPTPAGNGTHGTGTKTRCLYPDECCDKIPRNTSDCLNFFQNGCKEDLNMEPLFIPYTVTAVMMLLVGIFATVLTLIFIPARHEPKFKLKPPK